MHRLNSAICAGLTLATGLVFGAAQPAAQELPQALEVLQAQQALHGAWTATKAERDGKSANDVVGHRLAFVGNRFEIQSKDAKFIYAGTVSVQPNAKPAAIDFVQTEGIAKGQTWKGIFALSGDTLTIIDNAVDPSKERPQAFATKSGSGYVLITFQRAKP
jgi:uncharacterized protein (TIGR03067 family)